MPNHSGTRVPGFSLPVDDTPSITFSGNEITDLNRVVQGDGRAFDASVGIFAGTTNQALNGSAELNTVAHTGQHGGTVSVSSDIALFGKYAFKIVCDGTSNPGIFSNPNGARISINAGAVYASSCWIFSPVAQTMYANIEWYKSSGPPLISSSRSGNINVPANQWTQISTVGVAPALASLATPTFYSALSPAAGTIIYYDGMQFEQKQGAPNPLTTSGNEITDATRAAAVSWTTTQQGGQTDFQGITPGWKNLCTNGDFESGVTGWTFVGGGGTIAVDTTKAKTGTQSALVNVTNSANFPAFSVTVAASTPYSYGMWVNPPVDSYFFMQFTDSTDQGLSGPVTHAPANTWTLISGTGKTDSHTTRNITVRLCDSQGNVITGSFNMDAVQLEAGTILHSFVNGTQPSVSTPDSSYFTGRAATNQFRRAQCDATTDWIALATGASVSIDTNTPALVSPQSIKVTCDGTTANQGVQPSTASGLAAVAGTSGVGSIYFKGVGGQTYYALLYWTNTDSTVTVGTQLNFTATGDWQLVVPPSVAVAAGKTGTSFLIQVAVAGTRAESFWVAHAMLEIGPSVVAPYIPTSGGVTATKAAARVQASASLLSATQGWVAMRVRQGSSGNGVAFQFGQSSNKVYGSYVSSLGVWQTGKGTDSPARITATRTVGALDTLVFAWDANNSYVSVNGSAFVSQASTYVATPTSLDIGSDIGINGWLDSDVLWFACGTGTLVNADATTINGFGNTDPLTTQFPSTSAVTAVWSADNSMYTISTNQYPTPYVNTLAANATRGAGTLTLPSGKLQAETGSWIGFRVRMGYGKGQRSDYPGLFNWESGTQHQVLVYTYPPSASITLKIKMNGTTYWEGGINNAYLNAGDMVTVFVYFSTSGCFVSVNGSTFYTRAGAVPTGLQALLASTAPQIGVGDSNGAIDSYLSWFACGTGTIGDGTNGTSNDVGSLHQMLANGQKPQKSQMPAAMGTTFLSNMEVAARYPVNGDHWKMTSTHTGRWPISGIVNYAKNPNFAKDTTHWGVFGGAGITGNTSSWNSTGGKNGTGAAQFSGTGGATNSYSAVTQENTSSGAQTLSTLANVMPCYPGQVVRARASGQVTALSAGPVDFWLGVMFYDANANYVTSATLQDVTSITVGQWYDLTGTTVVPANAAYAALRFQLGSNQQIPNGATFTWLTDNCQICDNAIDPGLYVDGDTTGFTWMGTAETSWTFAPRTSILSKRGTVTRNSTTHTGAYRTVNRGKGYVNRQVTTHVGRLTSSVPARGIRHPALVIFEWADGPGRRIVLRYRTDTQTWEFIRDAPSGGEVLTSAAEILSSGQSLNITARWEQTKIGISINGSAFVDVPQTVAPNIQSLIVLIGKRAQSFGLNIAWEAGGVGKLTNTDAANLAGFGDTPPRIDQLPDGATVVRTDDAATATFRPDQFIRYS